MNFEELGIGAIGEQVTAGVGVEGWRKGRGARLVGSGQANKEQA